MSQYAATTSVAVSAQAEISPIQLVIDELEEIIRLLGTPAHPDFYRGLERIHRLREHHSRAR